MLPSTAAETRVIVPFRPMAGNIDEMCFEYGAVQMINFAPPRAWKYSITFVFDESTYSTAPRDLASLAFELPDDTA